MPRINERHRHVRGEHPAVRRGRRDKINRVGGKEHYNLQSLGRRSAFPRLDTAPQRGPSRGGRLQDRLTFVKHDSTQGRGPRAATNARKQAGHAIISRSPSFKVETSKTKNRETNIWMEASHNASTIIYSLIVNNSSNSDTAADAHHAATPSASPTLDVHKSELSSRAATTTSMAQRVNQAGAVSKPKRPVNRYRGKDPIKRLVQNRKLQAILADKPLPRERRVPREARPILRMGISKMT